MVNPVYKKRPTCAQILSYIDEWSISLDDLTDLNYSQYFIENSFFKNYFDSILLRNSLKNNSNKL